MNAEVSTPAPGPCPRAGLGRARTSLGAGVFGYQPGYNQATLAVDDATMPYKASLLAPVVGTNTLAPAASE